jgi:hypothetical protein
MPAQEEKKKVSKKVLHALFTLPHLNSWVRLLDQPP